MTLLAADLMDLFNFVKDFYVSNMPASVIITILVIGFFIFLFKTL